MAQTPRFTDWTAVQKFVVDTVLEALRAGEYWVDIAPDDWKTPGDPATVADFYFDGKPYKVPEVTLNIQEVVKFSDNDN